MPTAMIDGIETYYETHGSGTPILMCAPGGFDATVDKWRNASAWTGIDAIAALAAEHLVILYDRRECGRSERTRRAAGLGKLHQSWQNAARSSEHFIGVDYGRLHGLFRGACIRRALSRGNPRSIAALAGGRLSLEN